MTTPSLASTPQLPHQTLIHSKLPGWLVDAGAEQHRQIRTAVNSRPSWIEHACDQHPETAQALISTYTDYRHAEAQARSLISTLPDLQNYAERRLEPALLARFGLDLDVRRTYLLNLPKAEAYRAAHSSFIDASKDPFVVTQQALKLATQSLLHCALQNFEATEAQPGGLRLTGPNTPSRNSVIMDSADISPGASTQSIDLAPEAFAALARELDIGGNYQALIEAIYTPPAHAAKDAAAVWSTLREEARLRFRLHVYKACLEGAIDAETQQVLLAFAAHGAAEHQGKAVQCARMQLLHATLTGAVTFGLTTRTPSAGKFPPYDFPYAGWLVIYLPGTPHPLTVHDSREKAESFLSELLQTTRHAELLPLVPDRQRHHFLTTLRDTQENLSKHTTEGVKPSGRVSLHLTLFTRPWLDELTEQQKQRLLDDAAFHAVPTAEEDRKTAEARRAYFLQLGLGAFNAGAFFIPALRLPMLALTIVQLGHETFEAMASWAADQREQALSYLMDVVENIALIAAAGAAESGAGEVPAVQKAPIEVPSFIEELAPISLPDGSRRLWQADLSPFAHDVVLPSGLQPDALGLYHYQGKTWLPLDGRTHAVEQAAESGYRMLHPTRATSYRPPLLHNDAGAWLTPLDDPQHWQGLRLLRRLGDRFARFDDTRARQLLHVTGIDESVLRKVLTDSERPPALLEDTRLRFELDHAVHHELPLATRAQRQAEFHRRYRLTPINPSAQAALLRRVYPQLPAAIIDELLRHGSAAELQTLAEGKVPLRLGEEVRRYQEQIRVARAYEGVYLETAGTVDTDVLVLSTAPQLPEWPNDLCLELYDGRRMTALIDSVGPTDATTLKVITRYPDGYTVSTPFPGSAKLQLHPSLFDALAQALGLLEDNAVETLRKHVLQAPAFARKSLRSKLGLCRRTLVSPMRLADGRYGYPLSPTPSPRPILHDLGRLDWINRHLRQIQERGLQPAISHEILRILAEMPLDHQQITARIAELPVEGAQALESSVVQWQAGPAQVMDPEARAYSRNVIEIALWRHWIDTALPEVSEGNDTLLLSRVFIAEFPRHLPTTFTASVRHLHLADVWLDDSLTQSLSWSDLEPHLDNLFRLFPHLDRLTIERAPEWNMAPTAFQHSLPLIARRLPNLTELRITHQGIELSAEAIGRLANIGHLRWLDLSGNTLIAADTGRFDILQLQYLGLEHMTLTHWPGFLTDELMENVEWLSLRWSNLTSVPASVQLNPLSSSRTTLVSLQGNPLGDLLLRNLAFSEDGLNRRFRFEVGLPPAMRHSLRTLLNQRNALRQALDQWFNSPLLEDESPDMRTALAHELCEFWESRVRDLDTGPLQLTDLSLDHWPSGLPVSFYRQVDHLIAEDLSASREQLDSFLRSFTSLTHLTLSGNVQSLGALPAALSEQPLLCELELVNQGLLIDDDTLHTLLQLPALTSLDLSDNQLSPSIRGPFQPDRRLANLSLNNIGMTVWQDWLFDIMPTQSLDLGENRMSRLPEGILQATAVDGESTRIALSGNPLDEDVRQRIEAHHAPWTVLLPHGYRPR